VATTTTIPVTPVQEPARHDTDNVSKFVEPVNEALPSMTGKTKKVAKPHHLYIASR